MDFRGTLPVKDGSAKAGHFWGLGFGERRPLLWPRVLVIWLDFRTPESGVEERDLLDLAPVDERGQHGGPAGDTPG